MATKRQLRAERDTALQALRGGKEHGGIIARPSVPREQAVASLRRKIADRNEEIRTLRRELAEANATIHALKWRLANANVTIGDLRRRLTAALAVRNWRGALTWPR